MAITADIIYVNIVLLLLTISHHKTIPKFVHHKARMKDHHSKATAHLVQDNGGLGIVWVWDPGKGSLISYHQKSQYTRHIDLDEISTAVPKGDIKNTVDCCKRVTNHHKQGTFQLAPKRETSIYMMIISQFQFLIALNRIIIFNLHCNTKNGKRQFSRFHNQVLQPLHDKIPSKGVAYSERQSCKLSTNSADKQAS
jgi:hypothetical protein